MVRHFITVHNNLLCLIILSYTQLLPTSVTPTHHFVCIIDSLITDQTEQNIINYIEQIPKKELISFCKLAEKIEKQFPFIQETIIEKIAPNTITVTCNVQQPFGIINDEFIMTEQGHLYNKNIFLSLITEQLPRIILPSLETDIIKSVLTIINTIDPIILSKFTLSWTSHTQIYLYEKEHGQFSIVFKKNQLVDKKLFNHCMQIKQKLQSTMNKKNYVADIRFKDQIVVYRA